MYLVWKLLMKTDPPGSLITNAATSEEDGETEGSDQKSVRMTSANFAQLSGREEMTQNRLRTAQNRYLMRRAYASQAVSVL
jgi:hypothetical protein